jgi:probable rRNA maturation factor
MSAQPQIDVVVEAPCWNELPDAEAIVRRALAQAAGAIGTNFANCTVAVLLTDDAAMRRLNAQWRDIDKPTNVLSFPAAPQLAAGEDGVRPLGDIAIACETTAREARDEHKPVAHHLSHLAVHGFLHLLGPITKPTPRRRRWSSSNVPFCNGSAFPIRIRRTKSRSDVDRHA